MSKPLCIDLFAGLGGWTEGFLAEAYDCVGFDIERHDYGTGGYPAQLVLQDVLTLHGSQFRNAAVIVASPPCQAYSYRAMPWKRAKALPPPDNSLFEACFRIQREACEAAGRHIPLVVENVRGAEKWVGRAAWKFGSYYLWGDIPALIPPASSIKNGMLGGGSWFGISETNTVLGMNPDGRKIAHPVKSNSGTHERVMGPGRPRFIQEGKKGAWDNSERGKCRRVDGQRTEGERNDPRDAHLKPQRTDETRHFVSDGTKFGGTWWNDSTNNLIRKASSKSSARKAASAQIAKIPLPLSTWIAKVYRP